MSKWKAFSRISSGTWIFLFLLISLSLLLKQVNWTSPTDLSSFIHQKTPLPVKPSYTFQLIGDFARLKNDVDRLPVLPLRVVSQSMEKFARKAPIDMIFTTGDNFYPDLETALDLAAYDIFYDVFNWTNTLKVPFFLTYGNHDCYTSSDYGEELQLLYDNIYFPTAPHNFTMQLGDHVIDFAFMSCDLFCYGPIDAHMTRQCDSIGSLGQKDDSEYKWLEQHYEDIKDDKRVLWKVIFTHFPIFSRSTSSGDSEGLKLHLYPVTHKYGVDFVVSGHNHLMQHLIINKTEGQLAYVKQDYNIECMNVTHVTCPDGEKRMCKTRNVSCDSGFPNCKHRRPFDGFYDSYPYGHNLTYRKGEHLHQIIQGAGGGLLDPLCDSLSPMADLIFAHCDYGFSEIYIDEERFSIKYIHANTSKVLFESTVLV